MTTEELIDALDTVFGLMRAAEQAGDESRFILRVKFGAMLDELSSRSRERAEVCCD